MKIISLSSTIAGPACAIATSIKKYFYNNNYQTNFFDYLEISFLSVLEVLSIIDINSILNNNIIMLNKDNNMTIDFKNFDKILSHHDLHNNYNDSDYKSAIYKYIRRYNRLMNDIKTEDEIYFIRFGIEDTSLIYNFINKIKEINPLLKFKFINLIYNDNNNLNYQVINDNYILINFFDYIDINKKYSDDLYFKTIEFDWYIVYNIIYNELDNKYKNSFIYTC